MNIAAKGYSGGSVSFDGQFLEIKHGGLETFTQGRSTKRIHVSQITAIDITPANWLSNGIFTVIMPGALVNQHSRSGRRGRQAGWDPNAVRFTKKHTAEFEAIRSAVEATKIEAYSR